MHGSNLTIPTSIVILNKCISYPSDLHGVEKIQQQITAALRGVRTKCLEDIKRLRSIAITKPEQAKTAEKYTKNYGVGQIPPEGRRIEPPDFMADEWLDPKEPDFSEIHNGFNYEKFMLRHNFFGPETIKLPSGDEIDIDP